MKFIIYKHPDGTLWVTTKKDEAKMLHDYEGGMDLENLERIRIKDNCVCIQTSPLRAQDYRIH